MTRYSAIFLKSTRIEFEKRSAVTSAGRRKQEMLHSASHTFPFGFQRDNIANHISGTMHLLYTLYRGLIIVSGNGDTDIERLGMTWFLRHWLFKIT